MSDAPKTEHPHTGLSPATLRQAVLDHLRFSRAKDDRTATFHDVYHAVSYAVRDRLVHRWIQTQRTYQDQDVKRVYYMSAEYLLGRQLKANLLNLGIYEAVAEGMGPYNLHIDTILSQEEDPGLGNGGLGRLAACFMDSLASLELPGMGYGIRYEFGIFRQSFEDGWQVERPDEWLRHGNPWEIARPERTVEVRFGGHVEAGFDNRGNYRASWVGGQTVRGLPYDTPVAGFGNATVNTLRLWSAQASEQFDLDVFNDGDYRRAVEQKALSESISKVLYPKDDSVEGKELRLKQQYFFVACSIRDMLRRHKRNHGDLASFSDKVAIQLNDTHPAVTVSELMRVLVDEEGLSWDDAWSITQQTVAYTNHTLLPEALERWSIELFGRLLPRHLQIILEINRRFLREVRVFAPGDDDLQRRMSIIDEEQPRHVRMAHLAVVGSHKVNGVAELHSQLLRDRVLNDFAALWPERFTNVTNGVTPRRWLLQSNPALSAAITARIGAGWTTDLTKLQGLAPLATEPDWLKTLAAIKAQNKQRVVNLVERELGITLDPRHMFDVQVKRIHEYKRQLMLCLYVVHLYVRARFHGELPPPRVVFFGGKAAPGYAVAKQHIKLIHDVAAIVNEDPALQGRLKVIFLPNYNVSMAELVIPGSDLSEQISMAGKEASGTGNMKFMMNGALTIGTLDGANIEIRESVGAENFFLFGLNAAQAREELQWGHDPSEAIRLDEPLQEVLSLIESGFFEPDAAKIHGDIVRALRHHDPYLVCTDFADYRRAQAEAMEAYQSPERWWPMVAHNIAHSGKFSSDRSIQDYAQNIWGIAPCPITLPAD